MGFVELLFLAVGLSMDAFAVSVCKGLAIRKISWKEMTIVGLWFGGFQALMPAVGYFLGSTFERYITSFDHWVAFGLLVLIGGNMIREAVKGDEEETNSSLGFRTMLVMAVATSIDALAVGITFAFLLESVWTMLSYVLIIGVTTFILSAVGVRVGHHFGAKYQRKAELVGGIILVLLGFKILLEHLGVLVL